MSWKQQKTSLDTAVSNADVDRIEFPTLTGSKRRNDPSGAITAPFYQGLNGTTLTISMGSDTWVAGSPPTYSATVSFTSDDYNTAINAITNAGNDGSTQWWSAEDADGFIRIKSNFKGGTGWISIDGGTAADILGFVPANETAGVSHPQSVSRAGDPSSPSPAGYPYGDSLQQGTAFLAKNEDLNYKTINRAIFGAVNSVNSFSRFLNKTVIVPIRVNLNVVSGVGTVGVQDEDHLLATKVGRLGSQPAIALTPEMISELVAIVDQDGNPINVWNGSEYKRVMVSSITYGAIVDATLPYSAWGTPDGKSVLGSDVSPTTPKVSSITIDDIKGDVIECTAADFVTAKVVPGDIILISGATNSTPFSHNGEFEVEQVISATRLQLRPRVGASPLTNSTTNLPSSLNVKKNASEIYGAVTVYAGEGLRIGMHTSPMRFNLTPAANIPDGTYTAVMLVHRTIRELLLDQLSTRPVPTEPDTVVLGERSSTGDTPRLFASYLGTGSYNFTLMAEFTDRTLPWVSPGIRLYASSTGSLVFTVNAHFLDTTTNNWTKDISTVGAIKVEVSKDEKVHIFTRLAANTADWADTAWDSETTIGKDIVTSAITATSLTLDSIISNTNIQVGGNLTATETDALKPRIFAYYSQAANVDWTLLLESDSLPGGNTQGCRVYASPSGAFAFVANATWNGTAWTKDGVGHALMLVLDPANGVTLYGKDTATVGTWTLWDNTSIRWDQTTATLHLGESIDNIEDTVVIGNNVNPTTFNSVVRANQIDQTSAAVPLNLGTDAVVGGDVNISKAGNTTTVNGLLSAPGGISTYIVKGPVGGNLSIGTYDAVEVHIANAATPTFVQGDLSITGNINFPSPVTYNIHTYTEDWVEVSNGTLDTTYVGDRFYRFPVGVGDPVSSMRIPIRGILRGQTTRILSWSISYQYVNPLNGHQTFTGASLALYRRYRPGLAGHGSLIEAFTPSFLATAGSNVEVTGTLTAPYTIPTNEESFVLELDLHPETGSQTGDYIDIHVVTLVFDSTAASYPSY